MNEITKTIEIIYDSSENHGECVEKLSRFFLDEIKEAWIAGGRSGSRFSDTRFDDHLKSKYKIVNCQNGCDWPNCTLDKCVTKFNHHLRETKVIRDNYADQILRLKSHVKDSQSEIESLREEKPDYKLLESLILDKEEFTEKDHIQYLMDLVIKKDKVIKSYDLAKTKSLELVAESEKLIELYEEAKEKIKELESKLASSQAKAWKEGYTALWNWFQDEKFRRENLLPYINKPVNPYSIGKLSPKEE